MKQLFFLTLLSLTFACNNTDAQDQSQQPSKNGTPSATSTDYRVLKVADFKQEMQDDNVQIVDVRTPQEYGSSHIDGAINVNVLDPNFPTQIKAEVATDQQVMIYCRSGKRSARAARIMKDLGYPVIYDLRGGYLAWSRAQ